MSMHRIPLTNLEAEGLKAHGLDIGTPSQLSDAFRQGVAWALEKDTAMRKTLELAGYTDYGGELWKPPLGPSVLPFINKVDLLTEENKSLREQIAKLTGHSGDSHDAT